MKTLYIKVFATLSLTMSFLFNYYIGYGQNNSINIRACSFPDSQNTSKYARMRIELTNSSTKSIRIPSFLQVGIKNDPYADLIVELRKWTKDSIFVPVELSDEYLPAIDHAVILDLPPSSIITDTINIALYYQFAIGKYQGRVMYKAKKYDSDIENVYSNWVEFKVSEIIPTKTYKPRFQ